MSGTTLSQEHVDAAIATLGAVPPPPGPAARRPISVLYGGAHLFKAAAPAKLAKIARASLDRFGADEAAFAEIVGLADDALVPELSSRLRAKLERAAVESMVIDFEDGYGQRPDAEEDADAVRAATELGALASAAGERPIVGMRIKALSAASARRAMRTLDLFVTALPAVPDGFTVTLPKVERTPEVAALADLLGALEAARGWPRGSIGIELMIESPLALVGEDGRIAVRALAEAAGGRCKAVHLGAYDLTASLGVTAGDQRMDHPACEAARILMQMALAATDVAVVDGATTTLPLGDDAAAVHDAWRMHAIAVRRALDLGISAGWDLHPAQLPARYGAVFAFFLAERDAMAARLARFVEEAARATRSGQVFDDAATGRGLVGFFLRGVACGALTEEDVAKTGLGTAELRALSFVAAREART